MITFFKRLLNFGAGRPTPPRPAAPATVNRRSTSVSIPAVNLPSAVLVASARRPLIGPDGAIVGFEFRLSQALQQRLRRRQDKVAQAAHVAALLASTRLVAQSGRRALALIPADWLAAVSEPLVEADVMIGLELAEHAQRDAQPDDALAAVLANLKSQGARLGWDAVPGLAMTPDFLLLRQGPDPMSLLLATRRTWPPTLQRVPVLATDIAAMDDLELALNDGVQWACAAMAPADPHADRTDVLPMPPEMRRVALLLTRLGNGAETALIADEIKGDIGLSYRLLRRVSTARFAGLNAGGNIDQAVRLLGRNELYRWLSMLMVQFAGSRRVASALQEVALWRARLLELLAIERGEPEPGRLFTLGLASMLGALFKVDMVELVKALNLPEAARQALLEGRGEWHPYLEVAQGLEAQTLDEDSAIAGAFGGLSPIVKLSDQAWAWAAENVEPATAPEAVAA